jgi:hypothetical protein
VIAVILSGDKFKIGCFRDRVEALGGVFLVMEMAEGVDLAEYLGEWLWQWQWLIEWQWLIDSALAGSGV